jgi:predicted RNA binding protein YcfA (HicA-like mRNA interferase family)
MVGRLPGIRAKELISALEKAGFEFQRQNGGHVSLRHPDTARTVTVPVHSRELPRWLLKKIIKDTGLSEDEFRKLL